MQSPCRGLCLVWIIILWWNSKSARSVQWHMFGVVYHFIKFFKKCKVHAMAFGSSVRGPSLAELGCIRYAIITSQVVEKDLNWSDERFGRCHKGGSNL